MWLKLLIILGTCAAGVVLGFFIHWIVIKIKKTLWANQSNSLKEERQTPLTITEDIDDPSLEQPLNEGDYTPDIQRETDTETEDDDWLNNVVSEASAIVIKKEDDWLNAGVEEVPTNVYKQQDDDWLNAENNQPMETEDESSLNHASTNRPAIQIKQDGSILNITVTASKKQDMKSEKAMINLKINLPPQDLARKGEGPYDIEIITDESSPPYQSLQDTITVKPVEEPVNQSHSLMDEITVRPVESPVLISPQLMDEITVRPVESPVLISPQLMDEITVRPVESPVLISPQLMDEITVRPVENQVTESHALMDEITIKPSPGLVNIEYELMDDLITKRTIYRTEKAEPSNDAVITNSVESPVEKAEPAKTISVNDITEILNEERDFKRATIPSVAAESRSTPFLTLIGKGTGNLLSQAKNLYNKAKLRGVVTKAFATLRIYNNNEYYIQDTNLTYVDTEKAEPSNDAVITNSVESPVEKAEPAKTISVNDITEILNEERDFKRATIPSVAAESRSTPFLTLIGKGTGNLLSQAKNLYNKAKLRGVVTKAFATLRIYNNNEYYIQDTNLTYVDTLMQKPQIKNLTFKVLNTATELDELIDGGYDLAMNFREIKRGLKKGMVAFIISVDGELASMGWACITKESKATFKGYPYNDDLDRQACIVGDWTNPKFLDSGISSYVKYKRQQLLKEKGITFERSIVEGSIFKDLRSIIAQKRFELTYKRRTYTNVSLPGILGVEFWKEHQLNETDTKLSYQMITLLCLVLPIPPKLSLRI